MDRRQAENPADIEAAGQGHRSRGAEPQVTVAPPPPTSWAAHLSRVTPEAAGPLPSQGRVAVGGAGVMITGLGPSTLSLINSHSQGTWTGGQGPTKPSAGGCAWGSHPVLGGAAGPSGASLTPISPDDSGQGAWLLPAILLKRPLRPLALQTLAASPSNLFGHPQRTLASSRKP